MSVDVYLLGVKVEEVPVVGLAARLPAVGRDVVLVHVVAGLGQVQELLDLVDVDAAVGVVAEAEHLEEALVLARDVLQGLNIRLVESCISCIKIKLKVPQSNHKGIVSFILRCRFRAA